MAEVTSSLWLVGAVGVLLIGCLLLGRFLMPHKVQRLAQRTCLLEETHLECGKLLAELSGSRFHVCPYVQTRRLIEQPPTELKADQQRLLVEEVHFVLCDSKTWQPRLAVLLLPESEPTNDVGEVAGRQPGTDPPLARLLAASGLPVLCVGLNETHDRAACERALRHALAGRHKAN
ncbi:MAG: hypothetical protein KatS3mg110_0526 [Pirellulaceae bacterium]|nr:MAG: hypothetical protein KatS3mg110_0526 [Pirellulaceae bacterium]